MLAYNVIFLVVSHGPGQFAQSSPAIDRAEKQRALHQPVCLIPMGQTIDVADLPRSAIRVDWMRRIKSSLPVSKVSIPATHDAGTALGRFGMTRCQVMTIPAQLEVGVRGFDVRLRVVGSNLGIYHGEESQKVDFSDVMKSFSGFLKAHPSEFLIVRIREEAKAVHPAEPFEAAFQRFTEPYRGMFYKPSGRMDIPTVAQLRGRILLLDNYGKLPDAIDYPNPSMNVQDDYDTNDMDKKLREIVANFDDARKQSEGKVWNVNYTSSCTLQVDQLANARAVNSKVLAYLKGVHGNLGLVLMNFPSVEAIHWIIESNY